MSWLFTYMLTIINVCFNISLHFETWYLVFKKRKLSATQTYTRKCSFWTRYIYDENLLTMSDLFTLPGIIANIFYVQPPHASRVARICLQNNLEMITLNSIRTKYTQSHLDRSQMSMPFFSGMELKVRYSGSGMELKVRYSGFVCDQTYNTFQQVYVSVCHLLQLPSAIQAWSPWVTHAWKQHHRQHYRARAWKSWAFCLRWFLPMWLVWTQVPPNWAPCYFWWRHYTGRYTRSRISTLQSIFVIIYLI